MSLDRRTPTENDKLLLFSEVDGVCPKCARVLVYEKGNALFKQFEVAHIYPLNPDDNEVETLKNEEKLSQDSNDNENLICLCGICHPIFDKPRTAEEYRELLALKKKALIKNKEKALWETHKIESEIVNILNMIADGVVVPEEINLISFEPKTIDTKTDASITPLTKRKISTNVEDYYILIKTKFKELDSTCLTSTEIISGQIKEYYLRMSVIHSSQNDVFNALVEWLNVKTQSKSKDACEIIISYFVQNCEVF